MSDEATIVLDLPRVEVAPEVTVLAGRYELLECIGVGGMGEVHLALDTLTGAQVAVKRMPAMTTQAEARVRRELAALRFLQVPGVVRLRDDGWDEHGRFLVMEHLRGDKLFERDLTWEEARRPFLELLDTLARVHALGIVHRDLKPGNVLLVDGHPVVLDFGISLGPALADRGTSDRSWTPGYASLQQRSGAPADVRDDLYAVGCMLDAVVDPPPEVAQLRRRLMADDPDLRPASAEEALLALGGLPLARRLEPVLARLQGPVNEIALRALFAGPSAFLHVPEDAARLLWARAGSDFGAVAHELESWLRRGLATLEGDQVRLRREALERLQLTMDVELEDLYVVAPARAAALADEGRLSGAQAWCELGLVGARERGDGDATAALLELLAEIALGVENEAAIGIALYEVERSGGSSDLQALLHARRALLQKRRGEAARILGEPRAYGRPRLVIWDARCRLLALEPSRREAELDNLLEWAAGDDLRAAKLAGWRGKLAYEQGRFEEAYALHASAAASKSRPNELLAAYENAALAAIEFSPELARLTAEDVARRAAGHRLPVREALATGIARAAAYRTEALLAPRPDLLDAAEQVGLTWPNLGAFALTEAAFAWRAGELRLADELARRAAGAFASAGWHLVEALAAALALVARGGATRAEAEPLARAAEASADPTVALQVFALLRRACPEADPRWDELLADCLRRVTPAARGRRFEVLSAAEAAERPTREPLHD